MTAHQLNAIPFIGQVVAAGGKLYATINSVAPTNGRIVELDPATGAIVRAVASGLSCPSYLAVDPASGDLFFQDGCTGSPYNPSIFRVNPTESNPAVSTYVSNLQSYANGLAFSPDGTLYAAVASGPVLQISGTAGAQPPTATAIATPGDPTGVAIAATTSAGKATALWVGGYHGVLDRIDLTKTPATVTQVVSGETNVLGVSVGPNGCAYLSTTSSIVTVGRAGGPCATAVSRVSTIASSLPNPGQAFPSVAVVVAAIGVAAAATLFITFPAQLFNLTFQENYPQIVAFARRSRKRLARLVTPWRRRPAKPPTEPTEPGAEPEQPTAPAARRVKEFGGVPTPEHPQIPSLDGETREVTAVEEKTTPLVFSIVLMLGALFGALLDPRFGVNWTTGHSVLAIALSIVFGVAFGALVADRYHRQRGHRVGRHLRALPLGLAVAAACVLVSRLVQFEPGYLYGVVCGVAFERKLTEQEEGHLATLGASSTIAVSVVAFFVRAPVNTAAIRPGAFSGLVVLDDLLSSLVVGGLVGSMVGLLPLRFMPGATIKNWSRPVWAIVFGACAFLLVAIVLRTPAGSRSGIVVTLVLFVLFAAVSVGLREYFARRWRAAHNVHIHGLKQWASDLLSSHPGTDGETTQAEQVGGALVVTEVIPEQPTPTSARESSEPHDADAPKNSG